MWAKNKQIGFTIVELLIVIVVIGILAAITIVAFNGTQNKANDAAVQSDLRSLGAKTAEYLALNGALPVESVAQLGSLGIKVSKNSYGSHYTPAGSDGYNLLYCRKDNDNTFIFVAASKSGKVFVFRDGSVKEGVGPLATNAATCPNNGVSGTTGAPWLFSNGVWNSYL